MRFPKQVSFSLFSFLTQLETTFLFVSESSIKGGEVSATAQGRKNGGTAQTQVSGTYTGKGSFSATAQTSDADRSAQAQVILLSRIMQNFNKFFYQGFWR